MQLLHVSFQVRHCTREDLNSVHKLSEEETAFDARPTFADTEGLFARNPKYFYVATDDSGEIIGFITGYERKGIPDEVLRTWNASRVGYIELMAVRPANRRAGVGTGLLNKLLEHFRRDGIDMVQLDVPASQIGAVKLYEKLGFNIRAFNMKKSI